MASVLHIRTVVTAVYVTISLGNIVGAVLALLPERRLVFISLSFRLPSMRHHVVIVWLVNWLLRIPQETRGINISIDTISLMCRPSLQHRFVQDGHIARQLQYITILFITTKSAPGKDHSPCYSRRKGRSSVVIGSLESLIQVCRWSAAISRVSRKG